MPRWYDSPPGYAHRIRSLDGDFLRSRLTFFRRPAVIAFLVLAAVLTALVFMMSLGRALDVAQYAGLGGSGGGYGGVCGYVDVRRFGIRRFGVLTWPARRW